MSRVDQHLQHSVMGMLGSFWGRIVTERTKGEVRAVATLAANAPNLRRLDLPMQQLINERSALVEHVRVPFLDGDFTVVGPDLTNVWRSSLQLADGSALKIVRRDLTLTVPKSQILLGSDGRPLGAKNGFLLTVLAAEEGLTGSEVLYVLPLPDGLTPIVIATRSADRVLVQGIDFETGPNYLILRESPADLFHAGGFTVLTGLRESSAPYDFIRQVNGHTYGTSFVAAYCKGAGSAASFERAAAQACGLLVLEADDTLIASQLAAPGVRRYVFQNAGAYDVTYPHSPLVAGLDYAKGYIVSNGFRLISGNSEGWLRRALGARAVSLDGVTTVRGMYLMPELVTAYCVEYGPAPDSHPHARVQFRASDAALLGYWNIQRNHELATGQFLSSEIDLQATAPKVAFDMHQLLENFYNSRLLLLLPEFTGFPESFGNRLAEFVAREKPSSALVLTAQEPPADIGPVGAYEPAEALEGLHVYGGASAVRQPTLLSYEHYLLGVYSELLVYDDSGESAGFVLAPTPRVEMAITTLAAKMIEGVDSRLATAATPALSMKLFNGIGPAYTGSTYVPNTSNWLHDIRPQLTGFHMGAGGYTQSYALIPLGGRFVLNCAHDGPEPLPLTVKYVGPDGQVFTTTATHWINDRVGAKTSDIPQAYRTDLMLYVLADPLPAWVYVAPIINLTDANLAALAPHAPPTVAISQGNWTGGAALPYGLTNTPDNRMAYVKNLALGAVTDPLRSPFQRDVQVGDSGTPEYILLDGVLYLYRVITGTGGAGVPVGRWIPLINNLIARGALRAGIPPIRVAAAPIYFE